MKKKIISLLLAVIMIVGMIPLSAITAFAENVPDSTSKYIVRSWDETKKQVISTEEDIPETAQEITADTRTLTSGWYFLSGEVEIDDAITVSGDAHIILANDALFTAKNGIAVTDGADLTFYAQTEDFDQMGKVVITKAFSGNAGIGSKRQGECGDITINGGAFYVQGGLNAAGIGGGADGKCGTITVNGGKVFAIAGDYGAGIGSGSKMDDGYENICAGVVINSGAIIAVGQDGAENIGAGKDSPAVTVTVAIGLYENYDYPVSFINIEPFPETMPSCVDGHRDYFKNCVSGKYYTTETLEPDSLIEDIEAWLAGEGNTGEGNGKHADKDKDGYCDTCGTFAKANINFYISHGGDPAFTQPCNADEELMEQVDALAVKAVENRYGTGVGLVNYMYSDGNLVKEYDLVPFGTESMDIYAVLVYEETEPSWSSNGHKAYYENTQDGYFYEDALCVTLIGNTDDLDEWLSAPVENGGGMIPATGGQPLATPTADDFTFIPPANCVYNGQAKYASVTTDKTGMGNITVKYQKKNGNGWDSATTNAPTEIGKYRVVISVEEGANYAASAADITSDSWVFEITAPVCEHENTEIVYEWNEDYTVCTATKRCSDCETVFATETKEAYEADFVLDTVGNCQTTHKGHNVAYFDNEEFGTAESSENSFEFGYGYHTDENGDGICDDCEADLTVTGSIFKSGIFRFMITDGENKTVTVMDDDLLLVTEGNDVYLYPYEIAPSAYTGNLVVPETVTYGGKTFTVTAMGTDDASILHIVGNPFMGCTGVCCIALPDTLKVIGESAFSGCTGLTEIVIPENVEKICPAAFSGCKNLKTVTFKSKGITKAPHGDFVVIGVFDPVNSVETVIVPLGTANAYKTEWDCFADIIVEDNKCTYLDESGETKTAVCDGAIDSNTTEYTTGWYALTEDAVFDNAIVINGDVRFILCNGATLTANKGILLTSGNSLTVYAQSADEDMGKIIAAGDDLCAGIGGGFKQTAGDFTVNGGCVKATGGYAAPGIGGGFGGKDGTFTKNGGIVEAVNGEGYTSTHEHTFADTYTYNETHHWYACTCEDDDCKGNVTGFGAHTFGDGEVNGNVTEYTCSECGYKKYVYNTAGDNEGEIVTGISYTGISLTLGSDIAINFYMNLTEEARQNGTMTFDIGGRIVTGIKVRKNENGYYFSTPLTALEMAETVKATFTYNGVDYVQEYSVEQYIEAIINGKDKDGNDYSDEMKLLARKIANYGYYAQIYLESIHTNVHIVNSGDGYDRMEPFGGEFDIDVAKAIEALAKFAVTVTGASDNLSLYGSTVYFDSATALNYYVTVKNGVKPTATAVNTVTGETKQVEIKLYKDKIYIVSVKDILATELADDITVTVNGEITLTGSVFAYCNSVIAAHSGEGATEKDTFAVNAMAAFYEYYAAAIEYIFEYKRIQ